MNDSDGHSASSCVPHLITTITRAQKWSMCLVKEMQSISHHLDISSKSSFSISCSPMILLQKLCECMTSLRACLERKAVGLLHLDMGQALESILHNRSPQALATIGQYLLKIRSDKSSFIAGQADIVSREESAQAQVSCSICSVCPLFEFIPSKGNDPICLQCYRSLSQNHSVRPCDLLSIYGLKLLRGEVDVSEENTKAVINVFEYVYCSAEFSASKAALTCICATLNAHSFSRLSTMPKAVSKIVLPRWIAHALFPEYAVNLAFRIGDSAPHRFAATLGWCQRSSNMTPLESAVFDALSGDPDQTSMSLASKTGRPLLVMHFTTVYVCLVFLDC